MLKLSDRCQGNFRPVCWSWLRSMLHCNDNQGILCTLHAFVFRDTMQNTTILQSRPYEWTINAGQIIAWHTSFIKHSDYIKHFEWWCLICLTIISLVFLFHFYLSIMVMPSTLWDTTFSEWNFIQQQRSRIRCMV